LGILAVILKAQDELVNLYKSLKLEIPQLASNQELKSNIDLENKIHAITEDVSKLYFRDILNSLAKTSPENAHIISEYIKSEITEINIKPSTKEGKIKILVWLLRFHNNRSLKAMSKDDILSYLNSSRKSVQDDPTQRWIGSYNGRQMILSKFFKWLYNSNEPDHAKRITPPCMQGVKRLPRKEKTRYRPSDIWEAREHAIFLKYCPDKRDRCYHAMANDMSARPHEILQLKISDIKFTIADEGSQYAEVRIRDGKTGPRGVPLIDSIPYVKEWISNHPTGANPESYLFVSRCFSSYGKKLTYDGLVSRYSYYYKAKYFPNLLDDNAVHEADKAIT
jgi:integrase